MQKKGIFTILGVMLAVVVASLTLVFAVGPRVSAAREITIAGWEMFNVDENNVLHGLSAKGKRYADSSNGLLRIEIPNDVVGVIGYSGMILNSVNWNEYGYINWVCNSCFYEIAERIVSISLPETLEEIGPCAFLGLTNLREIELPKNLTKIWRDAFAGCTDLTSITIPDTVNYIGARAFNDCWLLNHVELPNNIVEGCVIDECAFANTDLQTITIPENTLLSSCVFDACDANLAINCACSQTFADENWDDDWNMYGVYDAENDVWDNAYFDNINWDYVAPTQAENNGNENQNQENNANQNNNEPANSVVTSSANKINPVMAWIGGGIAAGLGLLGTAAIVVTKRRK